jgi:lipopolysaccharide transport system permease protein
MISDLKILANSKDLLFSWTGRQIRGRYQQSVLGWFWAFIQPAASVAIFSIIFTQFVPVDTAGIPYPIFSFVAVVPWTFFASSLADMTNSLIQNMSLVTKIYFPREALVVASMMARLLDFGISTGLVIVLFIIFRVTIFPMGLLVLPLILLLQVALVTGIGLFTSALNIFFRDVQPLLALVLQLWFYASPIIYPVTMVPEKYRVFYYLNPMAGILESYRDILLRQSLPGYYLITASVISLLVFLLGYWFFKRVEYLFADIV